LIFLRLDILREHCEGKVPLVFLVAFARWTYVPAWEVFFFLLVRPISTVAFLLSFLRIPLPRSCDTSDVFSCRLHYLSPFTVLGEKNGDLVSVFD